MSRTLLLVGAFLSLFLLTSSVGTASSAPSHYTPQAGDNFHYVENIIIDNGVGNYTGYFEADNYNGSISVTSVLPNGTESATYKESGSWHDNIGEGGPWSESGSFTFSATTFHYVSGTDNQSGYTNPYVWFFMNNSLGMGADFYALNTEMAVESTDYSFALPGSSTGYVSTIEAQGSNTYNRNDEYGDFTASYTWTEYFDPSTGYLVGYVYTEQDSNSAGDGFSYTDTVTTTSTSYPLTSVAAPPSTTPSTASTFPWVTLVVVVVVLLVIILVLVAVLRAVRARRGRSAAARLASATPRPAPLPRHGAPGPVAAPPVSYGAPTPLNLIPQEQPAVQQIVIRETVKVPCQYCGTLIDSTAKTCPQCGAPRT